MKSIVSYPERGSGGKNTYRGNCSPLLIEDLIRQYNPDTIADYMVGSGTTGDVAKRMGIPSFCYDLNRGFDLLNNEIKERPDFMFWHPPYWDIIRYSGEQYRIEEVVSKYGIDPSASDLSRKQSWEHFLKEIDYCTVKQFAALEKGGHLAILVGDVKKKRKLYSMILEIAKPGTIEQIVIKAQHNCVSDGIHYSGKPFIPIVHEYLLILRKDHALMYNYQLTGNVEGDIRDLNLPTWKDVVAGVLEESGGKVTLAEIYTAIEGHKRTERNKNWKEKIRQTLQIYDLFGSTERGVWFLVEKGEKGQRKIAA